MRLLQLWLKSRVPQNAWRTGTLRIKVTRDCLHRLTPWRNMTLYRRGVRIGQVIRRKNVTTDASSTGWGAVCDGKPAFGTWSETEKSWHKLSGAPCCTPSTRVLSPRYSSTSRSHQDGQHDSGSIYKSPRQCELATTAAAGERPPSVGRSTSPLHPGITCSRTPELRRGLTVEGRGNPRGVEITPSDSQYDLECIRQGGGGSLRVNREHSLPVVLFTDTLSPGSGCTSSQLAESTQVCLSSSETSASRALQNQRGKGICSVSGTEMAQSAVVPRTGGDAGSPPPVDYPTEERPPLSSTRNDMAPKSRFMEPSCLAPRQSLPVTDVLPQRVLNTISEARAPSTRRLYTHKWRVFSS